MKLQPFNDRLVVKRTTTPKETASGLAIPDQAQEKAQEGYVVTVGPGHFDVATREMIPLQVMEGDHVLFGKYAGTEIMIDGESYLILREDELIGKVLEGTLGVEHYLAPTPDAA